MADGSGTGRPLDGVRVLEMAGIGPAPYAAMMLADLGAEVIRVERPESLTRDYSQNPVLERQRRSIQVNLKLESGKAVVRRLAERVDVVIEGYRPGVMERLELGPRDLQALNPGLIYGRITGWGQTGPLSQTVGHDINYIASTGALHMIGRADSAPVPPLNLLGDFGGAGNSLVIGIAAALFERSRTGLGQVVDANVFDSTNTLMSLIHGLYATGRWKLNRGANLLDSGCPYYDTYECADGRYMAIGAIEFKFFCNALEVLGLTNDDRLRSSHSDRSMWPELREAIAAAFLKHDRCHWEREFETVDACVTAVLNIEEAAAQPHARARQSFAHMEGNGFQPAVSPRLGDGASQSAEATEDPHDSTNELLRELGYREADIHKFKRAHSGTHTTLARS